VQIVGLICSFAESQDDLLNLRRVNRLFQNAATKHLRFVHNRVVLRTELSVKQFLRCIKKREQLELRPFPFSFFQIYPKHLSFELLDTMGTVIGPHVERYSMNSSLDGDINSLELGKKLTILLSHSPQLRELLFHITHEPYLTEQDIVQLPASFPRLKNIGISGTKYRELFGRPQLPASPYPFLEVLIQRSMHLKLFKMEAQTSLSLKIVRFLVQNRPNNMPHFSTNGNGSFIFPFITNPLDYELMDFNLDITDISMLITTPSPNMNEDEFRTIIQRVSNWLERQTNSLTDFSFNIRIDPPNQTTLFPFPSLRVLNNLTIDFHVERPVGPNPRPILPFVDNQFPSLQKLRLESYREDFGIFGTTTMPSVQEIQLFRLGGPMSDPAWSTVFPNLASLHISAGSFSGEFVYPTIHFILTHLTRLLHLDLKFSYSENQNIDYWDLFTGGAPRPQRGRRFESSLRKLVRDAGDAEEPVNGIYQVPSLRNMTGITRVDELIFYVLII